jgi:hypothetical protein
MSSRQERSGYQPGDILSARELATDQDYAFGRLRRHDQYLHGWGVRCGLLVVPARDPKRPWAIRVCPGYAISPCGDEIDVLQGVTVDLADYLWSRVVIEGSAGSIAYVVLGYQVEERAFVESPPGPCRCDQTIRRASRLQDSFRIDVLWTPPASQGLPFDLCTGAPTPCPNVPDPPLLLLAEVNLPASLNEAITANLIVQTEAE